MGKKAKKTAQQTILIGAGELEFEYGFSRPNSYRILHDPTLRVYKIGGRILTRRDDFEEWLESKVIGEEK